MTTTGPPATRKLPVAHERDRLERQERRLNHVVRELRTRATAQRADAGKVPEPLGRALAEFESQLRTVRSTLRR
jgi:hypothetical protein